MTNVVRSPPQYFLPYIDPSVHTPYRSATAASSRMSPTIGSARPPASSIMVAWCDRLEQELAKHADA